MNQQRFLKAFIHTNIILHFLTSSGTFGEGLNIQLPEGVELNDDEELDNIVGFNFPKDSVFVFNRPTIINLGDIDRVDVIENLESKANLHDTVNNRKHRLLCRLTKVRENLIFLTKHGDKKYRCLNYLIIKC